MKTTRRQLLTTAAAAAGTFRGDLFNLKTRL